MANFASQLKKISIKFTKRIAERFGREHFEKVKAFVLSEIENHPVSRELRDHTSPSKFIPGLGSHGGSLFGFMGFEEGSDPVGELISYMKLNMTRSQKFLDFFYRNTVNIPDFSDMAREESLKLPWVSGVSWPEMIQNGVSGLRYFLAFESGTAPPKSISGEGFQAKKRMKNKGMQMNQIRGVDMPPVDYLDSIFKRARKVKV